MDEVVAISPQEIKVNKDKFCDPNVLLVINDFLGKRFNGGEVRIDQEEVVARLENEFGMNRNKIFDNDLLDVEEAYRQKGWSVKFDKPGYCESYKAHWVFKPKPGE